MLIDTLNGLAKEAGKENDPGMDSARKLEGVMVEVDCLTLAILITGCIPTAMDAPEEVAGLFTKAIKTAADAVNTKFPDSPVE